MIRWTAVSVVLLAGLALSGAGAVAQTASEKAYELNQKVYNDSLENQKKLLELQQQRQQMRNQAEDRARAQRTEDYNRTQDMQKQFQDQFQKSLNQLNHAGSDDDN